MRYVVPALLGCFVLAGCIEPPSASRSNANSVDTELDGGGSDVGATDGGATDVGATDGGNTDAGRDASADLAGQDGGVDAVDMSCVPTLTNDEVCRAAALQCGTAMNDCNEAIDCGVCGSGASCNTEGRCVCGTVTEDYRAGQCVAITTSDYVLSVTPFASNIVAGATDDTVGTSPFDATNSVPFVTQRAFDTLDAMDDLQVDITLPSDGTILLNRHGTQGAVNTSGTVVEFDPARVRVQSGTFDMDGVTVTTTAAIPLAVDRSRSFVVFYYKSRNFDFDAKQYDSVAGYFEGDATLRFTRNAPVHSLSGTWYVVEALSDEFTVQHTSTTDLAGVTHAATIKPFSPRHSFVIFSHATDVTTDDLSASHMSCEITSGDIVVCRRNEGQGNILALTAQVVSLRGLGQRVDHGQLEIAAGTVEELVPLSAAVTNASVWGGYAGKPGACYTNTVSSARTAGSYVEFDLTDGGQTLRARRGSPNDDLGLTADGQPYVLRPAYQVIQW